jgi:polyhydroxyalkanoate synthesis regulator phasin
MTSEPKPGGGFDPFGAWTAARDTYMENWSKSMIEFVNSEAYSKATTALLDNYLSVSAPFRSAMEKAMAQVLGQLNIPTRSEVTSIAERLTNIEMRLDDLDAKLDAIGMKQKGKSGS